MPGFQYRGFYLIQKGRYLYGKILIKHTGNLYIDAYGTGAKPDNQRLGINKYDLDCLQRQYLANGLSVQVHRPK